MRSLEIWRDAQPGDRRRDRLPPHRPALCHDAPGRLRAMGGLDAEGARVPDAQPHPERRRGQGDDARQRPGVDRRRAFADRRPRRALACRPGDRRGRAPGSAPRSIRIAPRAGSKTSAGKVSARHHREGRDPHPGRAAGRAAPGAGCSAAAMACGCAQASVKSTSFSTEAAPEIAGGRPVDARRHDPPPARRRLHGRARRPRPARALAAGPDARAPVLADFQEAALGPLLHHRPLVLRRAGSVGALVVRRASRRSSAIARSIPAPTRSWCSSA